MTFMWIFCEIEYLYSWNICSVYVEDVYITLDVKLKLICQVPANTQNVRKSYFLKSVKIHLLAKSQFVANSVSSYLQLKRCELTNKMTFNIKTRQSLDCPTFGKKLKNNQRVTGHNGLKCSNCSSGTSINFGNKDLSRWRTKQLGRKHSNGGI